MLVICINTALQYIIFSMNNSKITIGIPRALLYHKYGVLWENFFKNLNIKVLVSPPTNKEILAEGLTRTIDENCLPMKIFMGHVHYLHDRVTHIFIPRIASLNKKEENCMKLWALYDTIATGFPEIKLITYNIDKTHNSHSELYGMMQVGLQFNKNPLAVLSAYKKAKAQFENDHDKKLAAQETTLKQKKGLNILIFAHPYVIHDEFVGKQILNFFKKENINVTYAYLTDSEKARTASLTITKDLYWSYHKDLVGSLALNKNRIDGIVYLMAFSCGPDSLVVELCKRTVKNVPSVIITLDELQSDGGIVTRLESFVDIIKFNLQRKQKATRANPAI